MPKTTVDENDHFVLGQYDVGSSRERVRLGAVAYSETSNHTPNPKFGFRSRGRNPAHAFRHRTRWFEGTPHCRHGCQGIQTFGLGMAV